jgi:hypothetical protein
MMRIIVFVLPFIIVNCTRTGTEKLTEYELLGELRDNQKRIIKKVESGWIPGEDIWLKITRYDSLGNLIEEYGAKPYGTKYKETFKYDDQNRIIEKRIYSYKSPENEFSDFENYGPKSTYELKDTLVDFRVTENQLEYKTNFSFDDKSEMTKESRYEILLDSISKEYKSFLVFDTLYRSRP